MKNYKPGNLQNQGYYKSFQPTYIDKQWLLDDMEVQQLLSQADRQLGRLDMYSEYIPMANFAQVKTGLVGYIARNYGQQKRQSLYF